MGQFIITLLIFWSSLSLAQEFKNFSEPLTDDNFELFTEGLTAVKNIFELEARGLARGSVEQVPWSGSYWPVHRGILSFRFADPNFKASKDFVTNYEQFNSSRPEIFIYENRIGQLSPAEKYDLLVGDLNWTLSKKMWEKGRVDLDRGLEIPQWTGICHGWAAATQSGLGAPEHSVSVMDISQTHSIHFYPHDIKGLISFLWAESGPASFRAGNRCRQNEVVRDEYLRPVDSACLDGNPMTWHLAITNRVGLGRKSFVMDASSGTEVWNYAVSSYDYSYFNPRTFEPFYALDRAIEPIENMNSDRFRRYRSPRARFVVGIVMEVFHSALIEPTTNEGNQWVAQVHKFYYDLELDENHQIVGGEWHSTDRPDFIWSLPKGSQAQAKEDYALAAWDANQVLPLSHATSAIQAAQRGKILRTIVEGLHRRSLLPPDAFPLSQ